MFLLSHVCSLSFGTTLEYWLIAVDYLICAVLKSTISLNISFNLINNGVVGAL